MQIMRPVKSLRFRGFSSLFVDLFSRRTGYGSGETSTSPLKLQQAGYRNVRTPEAQLFHRESATRGSDFEARNHRRYLKEAAAMQACWGEALRFDPAYNPNLALDGESFALAALPRVSLEAPWFQPAAQRMAGSRTPPSLAG